MTRTRSKPKGTALPAGYNPAAELAKMRRKYDHKCEWCGKEFRGINVALFCSNACRQANKYSKQKAKIAAMVPPTEKAPAKVAVDSKKPATRTRRKTRRRAGNS